MMELIRVREENGKSIVSARELHEGLEIKTRYNDWIKNMIAYGFDEEVDYTKILVQCVRGQNQYDHAITIDMAKEISMIQRNETGKKFRQYFIECEKENKVLNHIIDNSSDEQAKLERNKFRFSIRRTITTFENCNVMELPRLIQEFTEYISALDTQTRLTRYESAIKGIERMNRYINESNVYLLPMLLVEKEKLIKAHHKLENKSNGGIKAGKTKQISKLEQELDNITFDESNIIWIDYHAMSANYMYESNSVGKMYKTYQYKRWIQEFPYLQLEKFSDLHDRVDITKPMILHLRFVSKPKFDIDNLVKAFQDLLADRYGFNDVMIVEHDNKITARCEDFASGKIGYWIDNLEI